MPRISLENAFRYLFPAVMIFVCLLVIDPSYVASIESNWTKITAGSLVIIICGAFFYALYRTILYDYPISFLLDLISRRILGRPNYRTWLVNKYELTPGQAEEIYAGAIRPQFKELNTKSIRERSAQIHMLYQAGIIVFLFAGYLVLLAGAPPLLLYMLTAATVLFCAAVIADIRLDRQVQVTLQRGEQTVDKALKKMKIDKRKQT